MIALASARTDLAEVITAAEAAIAAYKELLAAKVMEIASLTKMIEVRLTRIAGLGIGEERLAGRGRLCEPRRRAEVTWGRAPRPDAQARELRPARGVAPSAQAARRTLRAPSSLAARRPSPPFPARGCSNLLI